jgi:hypothetical protein
LVVVTMAQRGRPNKYAAQKAELLLKFESYIAREKVPIVAEFASQTGILRDWLYDQPDFSTLLKKCVQKKEAGLERLALKNNCNTSMAIFSLKQLGWTDKHDHTADLSITVKLPDNLRESK